MTTDFDATAAAELFFAGAAAAGLRRVLICPGSRSSPLAIGATRVPQLFRAIHLDERSAGFAALGEAKASGEAVAIVCTSGTAGVNLAPAIAEAAMSNVSILAITADRPPEHQDWGVGQSLDQRGLFGRHVRDEITMPVGADGGTDFTERAGWRAISTSLERSGPVHVNWPFRLPLEPVSEPGRFASALPSVTSTAAIRSESDLVALRTAIEASTAPVIVAGPETVRLGDAEAASSICQSAEALGIPILADVLSGLRGHGSLVEQPALVTAHSPDLHADLIIHLGHTPTAKVIRLWWESLNHARHVLLDPRSDWQDPSHLVDERLTSDPAWLLAQAAAAIESTRARPEQLDEWKRAGSSANAIVGDVLAETSELTEAHIGAAVGQWVMGAPDRTVMASSSMPVRDIDTFAPNGRPGEVLSNRGINGIDGVVASAIGVWRARDHRVVVLIGDIAALHDVGSILDAARQGSPLTLVVPNNDGGGIFSNLPMHGAIDDTLFNELFHTPHGTDLSFLGHADGVTYKAITSVDELTSSLDDASATGVVILEASVNTAERLALRDRITERFSQP